MGETPSGMMVAGSHQRQAKQSLGRGASRETPTASSFPLGSRALLHHTLLPSPARPNQFLENRKRLVSPKTLFLLRRAASLSSFFQLSLISPSEKSVMLVAPVASLPPPQLFCWFCFLHSTYHYLDLSRPILIPCWLTLPPS